MNAGVSPCINKCTAKTSAVVPECVLQRKLSPPGHAPILLVPLIATSFDALTAELFISEVSHRIYDFG